jgi:hypothetical protein
VAGPAGKLFKAAKSERTAEPAVVGPQPATPALGEIGLAPAAM